MHKILGISGSMEVVATRGSGFDVVLFGSGDGQVKQKSKKS